MSPQDLTGGPTKFRAYSINLFMWSWWLINGRQDRICAILVQKTVKTA